MFKPVDQTSFGPKGDCQSACLASLLGMKLRDIPNFWFCGDTPQTCFNAMRDWLNDRGWSLVTVPVNDPDCLPYFQGYIIVGGRTSGMEHSVIWKDGKMVHDPHPARVGLEQIHSVDILMPLEPWRFKYNIKER